MPPKVDKPTFSMFFAGQGSGKTHMIKHIIVEKMKKKKFSYGIVFCSPSTKADGDYDYLPSEYVYTYDFEKRLARMKKLQERNRGKPAFLILDDVIGQINLNLPVWQELCGQFRHHNITILCAIQYITKVPPLFRSTTDYAFIFKQSDLDVVKMLYSLYGNEGFENAAAFRKYITDNTKDYMMIKVDRKASADSKDKFTTYRAPAVIITGEIKY